MMSIVFVSLVSMAQDVIFRSANDSIVAKILTVGTTEITYKKWNNLDGPVYSILIDDVAAIRYKNGSYDFFTKKKKSLPKQTTVVNTNHLTRDGNTYIYGDLIMNKREMDEWLQEQNCIAASSLFSRGLTTAYAGWALMVGGLSLDLIATIMNFTAKKQNLTEIHALWIAAGALEIACIPTIAVGYTKMHNSVNVYNVSCRTTAEVQPYWTIQASAHGIGLALKF